MVAQDTQTEYAVQVFLGGEWEYSVTEGSRRFTSVSTLEASWYPNLDEADYAAEVWEAEGFEVQFVERETTSPRIVQR